MGLTNPSETRLLNSNFNNDIELQFKMFQARQPQNNNDSAINQLEVVKKNNFNNYIREVTEMAEEISQNGGNEDRIDTGYCKKKRQGCPYELIDYVLPLPKMLYFLFVAVDKYELDYIKQTHVRKHGCLLRKVFIGFLQLASLTFYWCKLQKLTYQESSLGAVYRVMYMCFILLSITFYDILWRRMDSITVLLTRLEGISSSFQQSINCRLPRRKVTGFYVNMVLFFYFLISILFSLFAEHGYEKILKNGFLLSAAKEAEEILHYGTNHYLFPQLNLTKAGEISGIEGHYYSLVYCILLAIPYYIITVYTTITWVFAVIQILLWSLLFKKLFKLYFQSLKLKQNEQVFTSLLCYVRVFQKITVLIEDFNRIFGYNILFSVASSYLFISNHALTIINDFWSKPIENLMLSGAFFTFAISLLTSAEINNMASAITMHLKLCFSKKDSWKNMFKNGPTYLNSIGGIGGAVVDTWAKCTNCGGCSCDTQRQTELIQGINMIQHDLQANTIGLKGYGFFTISYPFISTVMGLIVTYSIMIQQWQFASPGRKG